MSVVHGPSVSEPSKPENPDWTPIPGIPSGHVNVDVTNGSDVYSNAWSVLKNTADVFDWSDTIPGGLRSQIMSVAPDRLKNISLGGSTYHVFLNVRTPPFNHQLAREAVITGLNEKAMDKLGGGSLVPGCFFLPPAVPSHPSGPCPYGDPAAGGNIAKARQLIQESGEAGAKVHVFSEDRPPVLEWMTYYASFLNQIGLKASITLLGNAVYFSTVGTAKLEPACSVTRRSRSSCPTA